MKTKTLWGFTVYRLEPLKYLTTEVFETREEARALKNEWLNSKLNEQEPVTVTEIYKVISPPPKPLFNGHNQNRNMAGMKSP